MRLVDLLPKSFVESDFVTATRMKYESDPQFNAFLNGMAYLTGAVVGTAITTGAVIAARKTIEKISEVH